MSLDPHITALTDLLVDVVVREIEVERRRGRSADAPESDENGKGGVGRGDCTAPGREQARRRP